VPQGGECTDTAQCVAGLYCVDDVCCDTPCNLAFQDCDLPGREGVCTRANAPAPAASHTGLVVILGVLTLVGLFALLRRRAS